MNSSHDIPLAWSPGTFSVETYRDVLEKVSVGLAVLDLKSKFLEVNTAFCETTGFSREELLQTNFNLEQIGLSEDVAVCAKNMTRACHGEEDCYRLLRQFVRSDSRTVWVEWLFSLVQDENSTPLLLVLTAVDITEQKRVEEALRDLSFFDPLTKLANRHLLQDRLQTVLARARRENCNVALLFIDLDRFKPVNDSLGHEVGDWLLQSVARRLLDCLRPYDTAARFGGDEFVILLPDLVHAEDAMRVAERILAALSEPFFTVDGKRLEISGSIGMSLYPDHAESEGELLRAGDEAMYMAKKAGRNRIVFLERTAQAVPRAPEDTGAGLVHIRWDSKYASGNVLIDAEHRELFRQSNQLLDLAMSSSVKPEVVRTSLQQLVHMVESHFKHEEKLLEKWKYSDRVEHAHLHSRLLDHARQIVHRMEDQSIPLNDLLDFIIREMIQDHLLTEDRNYFHLLRDGSTA